MVRLAQLLDSSYINYDGQLCGKMSLTIGSEKDWDLNVEKYNDVRSIIWSDVISHTLSLKRTKS